MAHWKTPFLLGRWLFRGYVTSGGHPSCSQCHPTSSTPPPIWHWSCEKKTITFHCTGCLIGMLIMVYYNPYTGSPFSSGKVTGSVEKSMASLSSDTTAASILAFFLAIIFVLACAMSPSIGEGWPGPSWWTLPSEWNLIWYSTSDTFLQLAGCEKSQSFGAQLVKQARHRKIVRALTQQHRG